MNKIICPVKDCEGGITTSNKPNPLSHIKIKAKEELLEKFLGNTTETPHADFIKENTKTITITKFVYKK